jgi:DNA-directed RNA polymerase specialized sigma24 family protein
MNQQGQEDKSLLERILGRDDDAMASLYDRYASDVYSMAHRILRDSTSAEQVVLDVFLEIWRTPARFLLVMGSLSFTLIMMARNRAVSILLHKPVSDLDFAVPDWINTHQELHQSREEACAVLNRLPAERRSFLEKAFFAGMTHPVPEAPVLGTIDAAVSQLADTGLEVIDAQSDPAFARRQLHVRDIVAHVDGMTRLARAFVETPDRILQELVTSAVELCGADSAGISIVQENSTDDHFYHWVATAGQYSGFLNARLPRFPSACGVTLERGRPQIFRVSQKFFDRMGVVAPIVTDGLLLPWQAGETSGTIWIMAHGREQAFDSEDCRMMQALANFAATGVRLQQQQKMQLEKARTDLAHQINNPLQGLVQTVFLLSKSGDGSNDFAEQAMGDLMRLSKVVQRSLAYREES